MFTKHATAEILDVKGSENKIRTASLDKVSDYGDFRTHDDYLYARIRAISSRVNKNSDGWPSVELAGSPDIFDQHTSSEGFTIEASKDHKYGFSTFVGKPIFVDHNNTDPSRARGVIVDAKFHVEDSKTAALDPYYSSDDVDSEHTPPAWVELLLEIDAKKFPRLAKAIVEGSKDPDKGIDGFSMGADVDKTICNICSNEASAPSDFCEHIRLKGATFDYKDSATNKRTSRKSYENCYGIKFFEISAVFDPADETALLRELIQHEGEGKKEGSFLQKQAAQKVAENPTPQSEQTKAPEDVDTLREEKICPVCGSDMDADKCAVCGYITPPKGLDTPDLDAAENYNEEQADGVEEGKEDLRAQEDEGGQSFLDARKDRSASALTNEVRWQNPILHPKLAGRINPSERPIKPTQVPATNEPQETVIKDEPKPVTSSTRTAADLIAAAGQTQQENRMSDQNKTAAEPADASGKPDKRVDVEGVGGVSQATNEEASKPEGAHSWENKGVTVDVQGKGGVLEDSNAEAAQPSVGTVDVEKEVRTQDSGPTKTWGDGKSKVEKGTPAVTDKAFPTAAAQGVKPIGGPDVQPQRREDVESDAGWNNPGTGTDQWTGTDGNGVTRQQNPVTTTPTQSGGVTSHIVSVFKLADTEVDLGMLDPALKYERVAELEQESEEAVATRLDTLSRVRTAGLKKSPEVTLQRLPSLKQASREEDPQEKTSNIDDPRYDSALFGI